MVMAHLDAAYNLARWLTGGNEDAEDVVQEACLRAFRFFDGFRGGDGRAWFLSIVRNTSYTWLQRNKMHQQSASYNEELHGTVTDGDDPEQHLLRSVNAQLAREALASLPVEFREIVVLREMEDMAYKEIARVVGVPLGTVMSRLARARQRMREYLSIHAEGATP